MTPISAIILARRDLARRDLARRDLARPILARPILARLALRCNRHRPSAIQTRCRPLSAAPETRSRGSWIRSNVLPRVAVPESGIYPGRRTLHASSRQQLAFVSAFSSRASAEFNQCKSKCQLELIDCFSARFLFCFVDLQSKIVFTNLTRSLI
jgi:hypothetical protein